MTVINRDLVSHHANRVLWLVENDDDGPLTPASDVDVDGLALDGRFHAVDSDGVEWVISVRPIHVQDQP